MSFRNYSFAALVAFVIFLLILLFGPTTPQQEKKDKSSVLWKSSWQVIEYWGKDSAHPYVRLIRVPGLFRDKYYVENYPSPVEQEPEKEASRTTPDTSSEESKETRTKTQNKAQEQTPTETKNKGYTRRRGGYKIKNIFSSWYKPTLKAYYAKDETKEEEVVKEGTTQTDKQETQAEQTDKQETKSDASKELSSEQQEDIEKKEIGLSTSSEKIVLYKKPQGKATIVEVGAKNESNIFAKSNKYPGLILLIPQNLISQFSTEYLSYRDKDIFFFPEKSYIKKIKLYEKDKHAYTLYQKQKSNDKQKEEISKPLNSRPKKKESPWMASSPVIMNNKKIVFTDYVAKNIENTVKRIKIQRFADDRDFTNRYGSTDKLWKEAELDLIVLHVSLHRGNHYTFRFRPIVSKKEQTDEEPSDKKYDPLRQDNFMLMTNSRDKGKVDIIQKSIVQQFIRSVKTIQSRLKIEQIQKQKAKEAKEAKEAKKKKPATKSESKKESKKENPSNFIKNKPVPSVQSKQ